MKELIFSLLLLAFFSACSNENDYEIFGTLYGSISDYNTGALLENATVTLSPSSRTERTAADGSFRFDELDAQQYTITVQRAGYQPNRKTVTVISGEKIKADIQLTEIPQ